MAVFTTAVTIQSFKTTEELNPTAFTMAVTKQYFKRTAVTTQSFETGAVSTQSFKIAALWNRCTASTPQQFSIYLYRDFA